jgi:iron complex transport system ATP-binding protein
MWRAERIGFRYPEAASPAVRDVSFEVARGSFTAVIGPNGSGKSTLLRLLLGTLTPESGRSWFEETDVAAWSRPALARAVGVVPQGEEEVFPLEVRELVAMGRYPHLGAWRREGEVDRRAIELAMRRCDVEQFAGRPVSTLSGGERQRARIARALAQEPRALALDEPTVALDVRHEMAIFELLRELGRGGATVLLVTHNLNLAARYADQLLVLDGGALAAEGPPAAVLSRELVERVWGWPVRIDPHPGPGPDTGSPQVIPLAGEACAAMAVVHDRSAASDDAHADGVS